MAIARALVNGPGLLLADKPTGAPDTRTGLASMALFQPFIRSGDAVLCVKHYTDMAAVSARALRFRDEQMIENTRYQ